MPYEIDSYENRRAGQRYDYPAAIEYSLETSDGAETIHRAVTINISMSGFAAYLFARHAAGESIVIKSQLPGGKSRAVVRWIKRENEGIFLAGLKFCNEAI